jgi:WD40 repeat protein
MLRVWNVNAENDNSIYPIIFPLESKGVSCCWNPNSPGQLLVGETSGTIKLWDLDTKTVIKTMYSSKASILKSVSWNPSDPEL